MSLEYVRIWEGYLQWDGMPSEALDDDDDPLVRGSLPGMVSSYVQNGEPEVTQVDWPSPLTIELIPKGLVKIIFGASYFAKSKMILFTPGGDSKESSKTALSLAEKMSSGWAGCVDFTRLEERNKGDCNQLRKLLLLYDKDRFSYFGYIPTDQNDFVTRIQPTLLKQREQENRLIHDQDITSTPLENSDSQNSPFLLGKQPQDQSSQPQSASQDSTPSRPAQFRNKIKVRLLNRNFPSNSQPELSGEHSKTFNSGPVVTDNVNIERNPKDQPYQFQPEVEPQLMQIAGIEDPETEEVKSTLISSVDALNDRANNEEEVHENFDVANVSAFDLWERGLEIPDHMIKAMDRPVCTDPSLNFSTGVYNTPTIMLSNPSGVVSVTQPQPGPSGATQFGQASPLPGMKIEAASESRRSRTPPDVDWRVGKSLSETMEYVLENDEDTRKDVTFLVGPEKEEIPAHKLILAFASPEFDYMLFESPQLKNVRRHAYITLADVRPQCFRLLLKFIYTRHVDIDIKEATELLKVAVRFYIHDLTNICVTALKKGLNVENVAEILSEISETFPNDVGLKDVLLQYIYANGKEVLMTPGFLNISLDSLSCVIKSNNLVSDELTVFEAAVKWAEKSIRNRKQNEDLKISGKDLRDALGPALFHIRFPLIMATDLIKFKGLVASRDILPPEEELRMMYIAQKVASEEEIQKCPFLNVNRSERIPAGSLTPSSISSIRDTSSGEGDEPPRKILRTDSSGDAGNSSDPGFKEASIGDPMEQNDVIDLEIKRPGSTTPPLRRTSSSDESDQDSQSGIFLNESNDDPDLEVAVPSAPRSRANQKQKEELLTPEEDTYVKLQLANGIHGNTSSNLLLRMMEIQGFDADAITEIREDEPIVINSNNMIPLYLPKLKGFHINYLKNLRTVENFNKYLKKDLCLSHLIFYRIFEDQDFQELWLKEVDTTIVVNLVTVLKMDFSNRSLTMSRIRQASDILDGVDSTLKILNLDDCDIRSLDLIPTKCLESLTMRKVVGIKNVGEFLAKCKNLKVFSCNQMWNETIDFGTHLRFFEGTQLRRIALGKCRLTCSKPLGKLQNNVEELYLDRCSWTQEFEESMPLIFPNLKRIKVCSCSSNCKPKLLKTVLEIESIEWMAFWEMSFKVNVGTPRRRRGKPQTPAVVEYQQMVSELKEFLSLACLDKKWFNRDMNTFILEKVPVAGRSSQTADPQNEGISKRWKGTKIDNKTQYEEFTRMGYDQFDWSMFYENYEVFYKIGKKG